MLNYQIDGKRAILDIRERVLRESIRTGKSYIL
jgi:hypothetical protein